PGPPAPRRPPPPPPRPPPQPATAPPRPAEPPPPPPARRPAGGDGPPDLLLQREEEPRAEEEDERPGDRERGIAARAEGASGEDEERVRREAQHDEADADRHRSGRYGLAAARHPAHGATRVNDAPTECGGRGP